MFSKSHKMIQGNEEKKDTNLNSSVAEPMDYYNWPRHRKIYK